MKISFRVSRKDDSLWRSPPIEEKCQRPGGNVFRRGDEEINCYNKINGSNHILNPLRKKKTSQGTIKCNTIIYKVGLKFTHDLFFPINNSSCRSIYKHTHTILQYTNTYCSMKFLIKSF